MNTKKGFTLIELLVVISIIALLSTVVLASMKTTRNKARQTAIISGVNQLSKSLEIYYSQKGTYVGYLQSGGSFFDRPDECKDGIVAYTNKEILSDEGARICAYILSNLPTNQAPGTIGDMIFEVSATGYYIRVKLNDGLLNHYATAWYCLDSRGNRRTDSGYGFNYCYP